MGIMSRLLSRAKKFTEEDRLREQRIKEAEVLLKEEQERQLNEAREQLELVERRLAEYLRHREQRG